jgi:uncharacterized repeat protein (TIGR04076 family)
MEPVSQQEAEISVTVISQKGHCAAGHVVGDQVTFDGLHVRGKLCIHALYSMLPKVFAMFYGAEFPWLEDKDVSTHACPDAFNPVVFEVRRLHDDPDET